MMALWGSSPLARGLRTGPGCARRRCRIIPARAGFTPWAPIRGCRRRDHPRSRGVYPCPNQRAFEEAGSSPLARGLPPNAAPRPSRAGIIPARAGFTRRRRCLRSGRGDHPRSRGVYRRSPPPPATGSGSSPLARGLRHHAVPPAQGPGIIPARAGFTSDDEYESVELGDHPRSRGVYSNAALVVGSGSGSSPLARGLPGGPGPRRPGPGIIPARAGFTR